MKKTAILVALCAACGGSNTLNSALGTALTEASTSGTLLCTPTQAQLNACSGKAANDACTLPDDGDGDVDPAGTCRTALDGTSIACVRNPPAPPQALVDACNGLAAGAACTATDPRGDSHVGVCGTDPNAGTTLVCLHVRNPPQAAVDACTGKARGDACTLPERHEADGGTEAGTCSNGPTGTGTLACAPDESLANELAEACNGLAAGAACTLGHRGEHASGTCTVPSGGTAAVCVVACGSVGPGGPGGGPGGHHH